MADHTETFERARAVACPACSAQPGQPCGDPTPKFAEATFTHGARLLAAGVLPDPMPEQLLTAAALRAADASERLWRDVLPDADRRLHTDPLVAAIATTAARLLEADLRQRHVEPAEVDAVRYGARRGAALALVIAERPELITGEPRPNRRPPAEVIAERIAPVLRHDLTMPQIREVAGAVLTALALQGWEVTWRADRFATVADGGRRLRLPLRGTCGICHRPVRRAVDGDFSEMLVGAWEHDDAPPAGGHQPGLVEER